MKVALVHDWLTDYRGGEKVLECMMELFPQAPIYTLFFDPNNLPEHFNKRKIISSAFLKKFMSYRRLTLPILPKAIEDFKFDNFDLILSSSSSVAKGIKKPNNALHISYCHSPMRYAWDQKDEYFKGLRKIPGFNLIFEALMKKMRRWDQDSSKRVDHFLANSSFVADRIKNFYGRESTVLHPPCDIDFFKKPHRPPTRDYFLCFGAFVPYKKYDLVMEAFKGLNEKLIVAGSGPDLNYLQNKTAANIFLESYPSNERVRELLWNAKALIFPQVEDFGIVAVEALAAGTPVLAYKKGGSQDIVKKDVNGMFFEEQSVLAIQQAITSFNAKTFDVLKITETAEPFSRVSFKTKLAAFIESKTQEKLIF